MRIAQISPLYESVPPKLYGGTERIVHYLTEELVRCGHRVTLFATGDSSTSADLVPVCEQGLRLGNAADPAAYYALMMERVFARRRDFDIIHSHVEYFAFPLGSRLQVPFVTTLHGRLDIPVLGELFAEFHELPLVSISDAQRAPVASANWKATVYHGIPRDRYRFHPKHAGYLAFLGRVSPEKKVEDAIELSLRTGIPLKIAAKVDNADRDYFRSRIEPLINSSLIEFVGEIDEGAKDEFLGQAMALLFPVDWPEPFGLVMIEALACGTPVIARRRGAVGEVMREGVSGFVLDDWRDAAAAVGRLPELSREGCRTYFEERFAVERMAADYLAAYGEAIADWDSAGEDWREYGGRHQRQRQLLHSGEFLPGRKAEPGSEARGNVLDL